MQGHGGAESTSGTLEQELHLVIEGAAGEPARAFALGPGPLVLGRSEGCDVVLHDGAVSRRHAQIESAQGEWVLSDLGSSTGTYVDGKRIDGPVLLRAGARLRLGRLKLSVERGAPADVAPTAAPRETADVRAHAAERTVALDDPLIGTSLGDLEIEARIGVGATGHVYRARQISLNRQVAVKVLLPALAASQVRVEAFLSEARAAARLVHPCIVTVFDAGRIGATSFFVMELMDGGSVEQKLAALPGGKIPWKTAFPMFVAAARGLAYLHDQGLIHRDVKPGNLLLKATTGEVKIADLSIALEARDAKTARRAGTTHYAAPEIVRGDPATPSADLYSLGATFHHILTGSPLYSGTDRNDLLRKVAEGQRPRVSQKNSEVPPWLALAVDRLTESDPRRRFASAAELVEALETTDVRRRARAMGIATPNPGAAAAAARSAARSSASRAGFGIAAALLLTAAVLGWAFRDGFSSKPSSAPPLRTAGSDPALSAPDAADAAPGAASSEVGDARSRGPAVAATPGAQALSRAESLRAAGRAAEAVEVVWRWARAPERRTIRDAETDAAVAACLAWIRENAPQHRDEILRGIASDQSRLAEAYGKALRPASGDAPREDLDAILTAKARSAALEQLAPTLRTAPMRQRAELLAAKLARVDVTWRRFVQVLGNDTLVKTWDEIRGLPQVPEDGVAWISRAVPPSVERISFDRAAGAARERVALRWTEIGVGAIARRLVVPYSERIDAAFRADLAEMFAEASCVEGTEALVKDAGDRPAVVATRREADALRALFAISSADVALGTRHLRTQEWARKHLRTDAFLRLAPDYALAAGLSIDETVLADYLSPPDPSERPR